MSLAVADGRSRVRPILLCLIAVLAASVFFELFPAVDIWVSGLFYNATSAFDLSQNPVLKAFRKSNDYMVMIAVIGLTACLLLRHARPPFRIANPAHVIAMLTSLALGPGLVVNGILKSYWGRPRPVTVDLFGGDHPYVSVWRITGHCADNCSFVSGETSSAVWLVGLAFLAPVRWRLPLAALGGVYALLISLNRIAFGGHFLSDVTISACITSLIMATCYALADKVSTVPALAPVFGQAGKA